MNGDIMDSVLTKLNHRYVAANRKVLLLMDNAGCHPEDLKTKFSNIKIVFLPTNTTSKLQPLDLGIIQNFKVHYRKLFLNYVLARIDQCDSASEVANSINILAAIRWVALAWTKVNPETISKCFRKAGVLQGAMTDVVARAYDTEDDPFLESDACMELQNLIEKTMPSEQRCSLTEYLRGEEEVPVCVDMDGEDWDANFIAQLVDGDEGDEAGDDDMAAGDEEPVPKYDRFSQVIRELDELNFF